MPPLEHRIPHARAGKDRHWQPRWPHNEYRTIAGSGGKVKTQADAIAAIAPKIGCIPQTLSGWVKQAEKDSGMRDSVTTEE
ncbi:hypothetical protein JMK10_20410, partial [Rhodovulum sulfidophilum]|nr:hypothetical protein [Rhodovulum sulfidophilum]